MASNRLQGADPRALNEEALRQLAAGDAPGAVRLLLRAVQADQNVAESWFNLAHAHRRIGQLTEALAALEKCVALGPRNLLAALEKGSVEEELGRSRIAAMTYRTALQMLPPNAPAPRGLEGPVQSARLAIERNNRELDTYVSGRLQSVRKRHEDISLARFDQCVDIMLQKRSRVFQQPTFMYFPELPTIEFYPRELFPELEALESASADIRSELMSVLSDSADSLVPYLEAPEGAPTASWGELVNSRRWSAYYFWHNGRAFDDHIERCPRTATALKRWPLWDVPGNGPTAMYSILEPKTRIPAHTGTVNTRLVVHLPLVIPPSCGFRVGGTTREWTPGEGFVFDDSINHEAWNDSDEARAVLIFTIWSPYLNEGERELVRELTDCIGDFYGVGDYYSGRVGADGA